MVRGTLADGRQVIIPIGRGALCAPPPLARSPKNLLSPWVIRCTQGEEDVLVHVPWWGFKRDKGWLVDLSSRRGHYTGWPAIGLSYTQGVDYKQTCFLHPEAIIVLQVREGHDDVDYGWYVRTRNSRELVQLPVPACVALAYVMSTDQRYRDEELLRTAHKTDRERHVRSSGSTRLAIATYRGYRNRVREASKKDAPAKKRTREEAAPPATCETCVVCLEERESTQVRCRAGTCAAKVCATCHADSRGLCPICDRGSINAVYPCERCYKLTPPQGIRLPVPKLRRSEPCARRATRGSGSAARASPCNKNRASKKSIMRPPWAAGRGSARWPRAYTCARRRPGAAAAARSCAPLAWR